MPCLLVLPISHLKIVNIYSLTCYHYCGNERQVIYDTITILCLEGFHDFGNPLKAQQ